MGKGLAATEGPGARWGRKAEKAKIERQAGEEL
jgi:hypothetical protein